MALCSSRLRRALITLCSVRSPQSTISYASASSKSFLRRNHHGLPSHIQPLNAQHRMLQTTSMSLSPKIFDENKFDEITEDTILFEGCDYNHWLITMDFPKDPEPTAEEKVETYVQTLAKGLGISIEEAKQKMYACSTTTYTGFQAVMTEEESKKFEGIPGVVFVLPDSYINPVNKEYGGDKYDNGVITHRPPPVQWGRRGGRYNDRNRNDDNRRYRTGPMQNQQGGSYDNRGYPGGRSYAPPQQNYNPQQSYGSPQQGYPSPQQNYAPPQQNYGPSQPSQQSYQPPQTNYGTGQQGYGYPQGNYAPQQNYNPTPQQGYNFPQQHMGPAQPNYGSQPQNYGPAPTGTGRADHPTPMNSWGPSGAQNTFQGEFKGSAPSGLNRSDHGGEGTGAPFSHGAGGVRSDGGGSQGFPQFRTGIQGDEQNSVPVGDSGHAQGRY